MKPSRSLAERALVLFALELVWRLAWLRGSASLFGGSRESEKTQREREKRCSKGTGLPRSKTRLHAVIFAGGI